MVSTTALPQEGVGIWEAIEVFGSGHGGDVVLDLSQEGLTQAQSRPVGLLFSQLWH